MADRVQGAERRIYLDGMHRRLDGAQRDRVTRIPRLAYSIASDLVAAFRPRFVSGMSTDGTPVIAWSIIRGHITLSDSVLHCLPAPRYCERP